MDEDRLRVSTQVLLELFVTLTRKVSQRCSSEEAPLTPFPIQQQDP